MPRSCALCLFTLALGGCVENNLGTFNAPPGATIVEPADQAVFPEAQIIDFVGKVADDSPLEELSIQWRSDLDGLIAEELEAGENGLVEFSTANLSIGLHAITLVVVDGDAERATDAIVITVEDVPDAPHIQIIHPASGEEGYEGELFEFTATVSDAQDPPEDLLVELESDIDGAVCTMTVDPIGVARCLAYLSGEDHQLIFRVTDSSDLFAEATAGFAVVPLEEQDNDNDGFTESQGDCDDTTPFVSPTAPELQDRVDNDCDNLVDEGTDWYDDDGDGYCEATSTWCSDGSANGDCNDADEDVNPGAEEICNDGIDNDCTGEQEIQGALDCSTYYLDYDSDSYGLASDSRCLCGPLFDWKALRAGDCDDFSAAINPGVTEAADGIDNNCDGAYDEHTDRYDDDGDGYCESTVVPCTLQPGQIAPIPGGDCDDGNDEIHPAADEVCGDGVDNNCAFGESEENAIDCETWYRDYDLDGFGSPVASKCLCGPAGDYVVQNKTDCYDGNPNDPGTRVQAALAHPGQTEYYTEDRGDGKYDYDCNSQVTTQYGSQIYECSYVDDGGVDTCAVDSEGWDGWSPGCGQSQRWFSECTAGSGIPGDECHGSAGVTLVQGCR